MKGDDQNIEGATRSAPITSASDTGLSAIRVLRRQAAR